MSESSGSEPSAARAARAEKGLPQIQWVSSSSSLYYTLKVILTFIITSDNTSRNEEPQTSPAELTLGCSRWLKASYSFLYVEVSSLILLFACISLWSPTPWFKYALSVASISFGICLILQTMEFLQPGFLRKPVVGEHSSEKLCSVFLLLWWIFGTGFITFKGEIPCYLWKPFTSALMLAHGYIV